MPNTDVLKVNCKLLTKELLAQTLESLSVVFAYEEPLGKALMVHPKEIVQEFMPLLIRQSCMNNSIVLIDLDINKVIGGYISDCFLSYYNDTKEDDLSTFSYGMKMLKTIVHQFEKDFALKNPYLQKNECHYGIALWVEQKYQGKGYGLFLMKMIERLILPKFSRSFCISANDIVIKNCLHLGYIIEQQIKNKEFVFEKKKIPMIDEFKKSKTTSLSRLLVPTSR